MPAPLNEHSSGIQPVGDYAPGARMVQPTGTKGTRPIQSDHVPPPPRQRRAVTEKAASQAAKYHNPPKRGRQIGSRNRPPITQEMLDAPPDEE
jgi:hypothetical protein